MAHAWEAAQGPLVLFTLFTQAAVGAFWVLLVNDFIKRKASDQVYDAFTRIGTYILVPLVALGLFFSTSHLGRPQFAFRALQHIGSSWLSREVWAFSLFFLLVAVYTYLWWRRVPDGELRRLVGALAGLAGLGAAVVQAMVYLVPGRPMWDHPSTPLLFLASAFLLGPLAVAVVYSLAWGRLVPRSEGEPVVRTSHRRLGLTLLATVAVYAGALAWRISYLAGGAAGADTAAAGMAATGKETYATALLLGWEATRQAGWLLYGQWLLSLALPACAAVALWWMHRRGASLRACNGVIIATLALAAMGELLGRALFYLAGVPWF